MWALSTELAARLLVWRLGFRNGSKILRKFVYPCPYTIWGGFAISCTINNALKYVEGNISRFNLSGPELFFLILAHPVYKMWIKQEPNTLELWNKLHFEEKKKTESIYTMFKIYGTYICWINI